MSSLEKEWQVHVIKRGQSGPYAPHIAIIRVEHRLYNYFGEGKLSHPYYNDVDRSIELARSISGLPSEEKLRQGTGEDRHFAGKVISRVIEPGVYEFTHTRPFTD